MEQDDLARRISGVETQLQEISKELRALIQIQERQVHLGQRVERVETEIQDKIKDMEEKLKGIDAELQTWRTVRTVGSWLFGGGLVAAVAAWPVISKVFA
jgi:phage shock protein A